MARNDEYTKMNDQRDETRIHDLLRDEAKMASGRDDNEIPAVAGGFTSQAAPSTLADETRNEPRDDQHILADVREALSNCVDIDARGIEVRVNEGEVVLSGRVQEDRQKSLSESIVENLRGVKSVVNQIDVTSGSKH